MIFQALDAAGKDGTIKHVMSGVNPQGVQVYSFKQPSSEELDHDFLWRCTKPCPSGAASASSTARITRKCWSSRCIPRWLRPEDSRRRSRGREVLGAAVRDINNFERHLARNGTAIVKFFLNVSQKEQHQRFLDRINEPQKHWKFSAGDLAESEHWDEYQRAYEECLEATSTKYAPWYVIPADHKWVTRAAVAVILTETIRGLDLQWPKVTDSRRKRSKRPNASSRRASVLACSRQHRNSTPSKRGRLLYDRRSSCNAAIG